MVSLAQDPFIGNEKRRKMPEKDWHIGPEDRSQGRIRKFETIDIGFGERHLQPIDHLSHSASDSIRRRVFGIAFLSGRIAMNILRDRSRNHTFGLKL